jgi:hypothetical protein
MGEASYEKHQFSKVENILNQIFATFGAPTEQYSHGLGKVVHLL